MIRTCVLFLLTLAPQAQAFVSPSRQNYKATTALEAKRNCKRNRLMIHSLFIAFFLLDHIQIHHNFTNTEFTNLK